MRIRMEVRVRARRVVEEEVEGGVVERRLELGGRIVGLAVMRNEGEREKELIWGIGRKGLM
jgi:hypothetical protein